MKNQNMLLDSWIEMLNEKEVNTNVIELASKKEWIIQEIKEIRQEVMNSPSQGGQVALIAAYDSLLAVIEEEKKAA